MSNSGEHSRVSIDLPEHLVSSTASASGSAAVYGYCLESVTGRLEEAVRTGSTESLEGLDGSYSAIVRDGDAVRVHADMTGQFPIFYRNSEDAIEIGSQASHLARDNFDDTSLAAQIAAPLTSDLYANRSAYAGVHRVEPGTTVTFNEGRIYTDRKGALPEAGASLDEAAELLRTVVLRSMAARTSGTSQLSCDFSGGLDSTSLAYIAASLREGTVALTDHNPQYPVEDYATVRALLQLPQSSRLRWTELNTDAQHYKSWLEVDSESDEPNLSLRSRDYLDGTHAAARARGSSLHLAGIGGDEVAIAGLDYLADLARDRSSIELARAVQAQGRIQHMSPWELFNQARNASTTRPEDALRVIGQALRRASDAEQPVVVSSFLPPVQASWLTRHAREQVSELAFERAEMLAGEVGTDLTNYAALRALRAAGGLSRHIIARAHTHYDIDAHMPFLDDNVVRASLSTAGYNRADPATYKRIMQIAFRGLVPPQVLVRDSKSSYDSSYFDALKSKLPQIQQLLADSRLADLRIIEPKAVSASLQKLMRGEPVGISLDALISQELWLRGRETTNSPYYDSTRNDPTPTDEVSADMLPPDNVIDTSVSYGISPLVHGVAFKGENGAAFFNTKTGDRFSVPRALATVMRRISQADSLETALRGMTQGLTEDESQSMQQLIIHNVSQLLSDGLLVEDGGIGYEAAVTPQRDGTDLQEKDHQLSNTESESIEVSRRDYVLAAIGTAAAMLTIKGMKFGSFSAVTRFLQNHWATQDASREQTAQTLAAVHRVGTLYPGRMACLEFSSSAALTLAIRRKRVAMVIGASIDPLEFDAWVEAEGEPVTRQRDDNPYSYTPMYRIGSN